jgi:hypothetical protein
MRIRDPGPGVKPGQWVKLELQQEIDAAKWGDAGKVKMILEKNPDQVKVIDDGLGATALHWAAIYGRKEAFLAKSIVIQAFPGIDVILIDDRTPRPMMIRIQDHDWTTCPIMIRN